MPRERSTGSISPSIPSSWHFATSLRYDGGGFVLTLQGRTPERYSSASSSQCLWEWAKTLAVSLSLCATDRLYFATLKGSERPRSTSSAYYFSVDDELCYQRCVVWISRHALCHGSGLVHRWHMLGRSFHPQLLQRFRSPQHRNALLVLHEAEPQDEGKPLADSCGAEFAVPECWDGFLTVSSSCSRYHSARSAWCISPARTPASEPTLPFWPELTRWVTSRRLVVSQSADLLDSSPFSRDILSVHVHL